MSLPIIEVVGLGKKFVIDHQQKQRKDTFRDAITDKATRILNRSKMLVSSERIRQEYPAKEDFWALNDVNFCVERGDRVGIIGRNGAGKSTLLKLLSRITEPTTGSIAIRGKVASLLEVGTGFHPELSGRENIFLNGAILGMSRSEIRRKFDEIVDFAEIEKFLDTPVKRYSSGMYVRLAFAVAAHLEPEILIIDEVLSVGDAQFQKKCLGKMDEVSSKEGRTLLFVSHNMTSIAAICNKSIFLESGRMEYEGNLLEGINKYLNKEEGFVHKEQLDNFISSQQDDIFFLKAVKLVQEHNTGINFTSDKDIEFMLEYSVLKPCLGLRVGFDLYEKITDSVIFRSFHDDNSNEITRFSEGNYRTTFIIEKNLFKSGEYYINVSIGIHKIRWIIYDTLKFNFTISNISGVNLQYADSRPGVIMPKLKTINCKLSSNVNEKGV
jgi:lipopolysaccharide transport system ATP-binding protein